jgi:hypothetical protein
VVNFLLNKVCTFRGQNLSVAVSGLSFGGEFFVFPHGCCRFFGLLESVVFGYFVASGDFSSA